MPADYNSTARALSLPLSPDRSPSPSFLRPPWSSHRRSNSSRRSSGYSRPTSYRDNLISNLEKLGRRVIAIYKKLSLLQKILAAVALIGAAVLGILFLIFNERIFGWLEPWAQRWKNTTGGWIILWIITFITAFPPVIGYSTCGTTAGFVYGFWEGWLILATATVAGSFCSFLASRTILRKYVDRLLAGDTRFAALTLTLKQDGLKLLCLIRLCPLPYSLSNGAMSTFPSVHPVMYAAATALVTPKLFIPVFIGSRLAVIGRNQEKMSAGTRAINYISIIGGALVGIFTGWYIYRKTMARARELEAEERNAVRDSYSRSGAPPTEFSDDPDARTAAETVGRDLEQGNFVDEDAEPRGEYRDEFTDDEDDVFDQGDGNEDDAINLHKQKPSV